MRFPLNKKKLVQPLEMQVQYADQTEILRKRWTTLRTKVECHITLLFPFHGNNLAICIRVHFTLLSSCAVVTP